uniref:Leprecan-like alpha-helical domain-containing protein n=1 Tax=Timema monikensis TaxID=170555 RepID=A0A7R9HUJ9_9NEOP|nr:unnamed protein product [Timema monikensis]
MVTHCFPGLVCGSMVMTRVAGRNILRTSYVCESIFNHPISKSSNDGGQIEIPYKTMCPAHCGPNLRVFRDEQPLSYRSTTNGFCTRCSTGDEGFEQTVIHITTIPGNTKKFVDDIVGMFLAAAEMSSITYNPDDQAMMNNLKFYSSLPEVDMNKIVNFEVKDYVPLYIHGSEAYRNEDFRSVIGYIEESLDELLKEEEDCRAFCEGPFDQGWFPDFVSSISRNNQFWEWVKRTKQEVQGEIYGIQNESVNNLQKSCEAVSSYLLFFPNDETMLSNKKFYLTMPKVKTEYFNPRKEAINYIKRQQYEEALLKYIEKEFTFEDASDNEVSPSDSMKDESF